MWQTIAKLAIVLTLETIFNKMTMLNAADIIPSTYLNCNIVSG